MKINVCVLASIVATVLLAGCSTGPSPEPPTEGSGAAALPMPAGAGIVAPGAPATGPANVNCGDPTASLRPRGDLAEGTRLKAIRERGYLLVGLDAGSNPFSFRDTLTGVLGGFDVDIAKEVARDLFGDPERLQFRMLGSSDRIRALQAAEVDIIAKTMSITCERRTQVSFSTTYFRANQRVLATTPREPNTLGRDIPVINGVADLANKTVCLVAGTTSLQNIRRLAPSATVLTVADWADCLVALQQRQVDAITTDDAILAGLAQQDPTLRLVGASISVENYGIGVAKDDTDLVRFLNRTLERIRLDGTWDLLYQRWLSILGPSPGPPEPRYQD